MNNITTTILQDTAKNINKEYSQNGFGNGASGYIVIVLCVCAITIAIYYIIKSIKKSAEDRETSKNIQNELLTMFQNTSTKQYEEMYKMNENIIAEIKEISQKVQVGIDKMVETNLNTTKIMYDMIESSSEKTISKINAEKELGDRDYEEHIKLLFEVSMLKLHRSLLERIEKNSLLRYKNEICGTEQCNFEDGELYSELSKTHISFREKTDLSESEYTNEKRKQKILEFVKSKIYDLIIPLCKLFCVGDMYDNPETREIHKKDMKKALSILIDKRINDVEEKDFSDL